MTAFREIVRFEMGYQARRIATWVYGAALLAITFHMSREIYIGNARTGGYYFNAPFVIATVTVLCTVMALPVAAALAGDATTRDMQTRMHALVFAAPVGETTYLGGRVLAAFALLATLLVAVPFGLLLATLVPGAEAELLGPLHPAAYVGAYLVIALPNAFVATAVLAAFAVLTRRALASYLGGALLFLGSMTAWQLLAVRLDHWTLAKLADPLALTVLAELSRSLSPLAKSRALVVLDDTLIANRVLWLGLALAVLAATRARFRFTYQAAGARRDRAPRATDDSPVTPAIAAPVVRRSFGAATHAWQTLAVTRDALREIVRSWGGLAIVVVAAIQALAGPGILQHLGVPYTPTTARLLRFLDAPLANVGDVTSMIAPMLVVFYAGELVWRERDARLAEITGAAPVPAWVPVVGKVVALTLMLAVLQALLALAGVVIQFRLGHHDFALGLSTRVLLAMQLVDYLPFVVFAVFVHAVVNHKHLGHLVALVAYALMVFAPALGIEHHLLAFGSDPGWHYSEMALFGRSLVPWLWLKGYWLAWALLLAAAAPPLVARRRPTRAGLAAMAGAATLVVAIGGYVFRQTNVLNAYETADALAARRAEYERRYGRFDGAPQPTLVATRLRAELHPARGSAELTGTSWLVNRTPRAIDSLHVATATRAETHRLALDRPATQLIADDRLGHHLYRLATPLQPGDSMALAFDVRLAPHGFTNAGVDASVVPNGTFIEVQRWLPAIGYQPARALTGAGVRRAHGLPARPDVRALDDPAGPLDRRGTERVALDVVVGTDAGQTAVAPGTLRRAWSEGGRRYFAYTTDAPIRNDYAIYSAAYAVRAARWSAPGQRPVAIEIVHDAAHPWNVDRMVRSVRASLDYGTRWFGAYPHDVLRLVEHPGDSPTLHAAPMNVAYEEGFALLRPERDRRDVDFPFAVVAHEVAHQWWGNGLTPAAVEGEPLLTESLAWYTALGVVERTYGAAHVARLVDLMREAYLSPRTRAGPPLLRSADRFTAYRTGPFAMHALRTRIGEVQVNAALHRLLDAHASAAAPLATSRDLYAVLRDATPDSLRPWLADLFERNTYWDLAARRAVAEPLADGAWRVTLDVRARKVVVDTVGAETMLSMDEPVEVGVYGTATEPASGAAPALSLRAHRIRTGDQRIVVIVPGEPARVVLDPRHLLLDAKIDDDARDVTRTVPLAAPARH